MAKTETAPNTIDDVTSRVAAYQSRGTDAKGIMPATSVDDIANHTQGMHTQALAAVTGAGGMKMR